MINGRERLIEAGLILLIFFAPVFFGSVYAWGSMADAALIFILSALSLDRILKNLSLSRMIITVFALVYFWMILQVLFIVPNQVAVIEQCILWMAYACLFGVAHSLSRPALIRILWGLALLGFFESCYGLWQAFSGIEKVLWQAKTGHLGYVTGTYFNRNHFAGLLELIAGIQIGLFLKSLDEKKWGQSVVLTFMLLMMMLALMKSGSRAGMFCTVAAVVFLMSCLCFRKAQPGLVFFAAILFCILAGVIGGWETLTNRFSDLPLHLGNLEGRLSGWSAAMPMLRDYAFTGVGLGNFKWVFPAYQPVTLFYQWDHIHNDYLELMIELGIPAAILLWMGFFMIFRTIFRAAITHKNFSSFAVGIGCLAGAGALSLHGLIDFNFAVPANCLFFMLSLGLAARLLHIEMESSFKKDPQLS